MALVSCPDCGKDVSTEATACPNCGHPIGFTGADPVRAAQAQQNRVDEQRQQPPKEKSRSTGKVLFLSFLGIGMFFAIVIGLLVGAASDEDTATSAPPSTAVSTTGLATTEINTEGTPQEVSLPGIGDPVRDGDLEFVVLDVENPGQRYNPDDGYFYSEADGTWLIVKVSVTNIGDDRQSFSGRDQNLFWDEREYSPSLSLSHATIHESLNPGVSIEATIMYDVPESFPELGAGTVLELHDFRSSDGVQIEL